MFRPFNQQEAICYGRRPGHRAGDFCGMGHNAMLIRRALGGVPRSRVVISVLARFKIRPAARVETTVGRGPFGSRMFLLAKVLYDFIVG